MFRKSKQSTNPGARAQQVRPSQNGDNYGYFVEKVWRVVDVQADGNVLLQTRRGKKHIVEADDPNCDR